MASPFYAASGVSDKTWRLRHSLTLAFWQAYHVFARKHITPEGHITLACKHITGAMLHRSVSNR